MTTTPVTKATPASEGTPVLDLGADLSPAVKAIETAYRMFMRAYAKDARPAPPVTIVVKRDERAWGHTTVAKVWAPSKVKEGDPASRFEIMISGENLRRGAEAVATTLLHEAAHARNLAAGVLDTDTNGRHNLTFKTTAEEHGLEVEADRWHGWTKTTMTDAGRKRWARLIKTIDTGLAKAAATAPFDISHLPTTPGATVTPVKGGRGITILPPTGIAAPPRRGNRNLLKAVCGCGHSIRVSRGVLDAAVPTCQVCNSPFEA